MPRFRRVRAVAVGAALALLVGVFSLGYTVERGDTLGRIASDHDVSLGDLIDANDISNPDLIFPGQILIIPGAEGDQPGASAGTEEDQQVASPGPAVQPRSGLTHVVVRGDTLSRIASRYGAPISLLVERNSISNPDFIRLGQQLVIPGVSSSTESGAEPDDTGSEPEPPPEEEQTPPTEGPVEEPAEDPPSTGPYVRSGQFHVVQPGEKLDTIAAQHGVTAEQIASANGILNGTIYRGTRLFLDGPSFTAKGTAGEISYTVQQGDRLGDIAAAYDTSTSSLVSLNQISNPNLIRSGDTLMIPSGTRWVCPIEDASFFNDWGFPRGGGTRFHEGNDLFTKHGAPVYAPVSGRVEFKTGTIGGKQFNLHGDDGVEYLGSHMSEFGKDGRVTAGDIVGYVGNTGNAVGTNPHLHFGMYLPGGVVINPYPTLIAHDCK